MKLVFFLFGTESDTLYGAKTLSKSAVMTPSFVEPQGLFLEHFGLNLQFIK